MVNIRSCKKVRLKTYSIQLVRIVLVLEFFKLLKNEESFGESFSFPFSAKFVNINSEYLF